MFDVIGLYWKTLAAALMPLFLIFQELAQDGAMTDEDWSRLIASGVMTFLVWAKANTVRGRNVTDPGVGVVNGKPVITPVGPAVD